MTEPTPGAKKAEKVEVDCSEDEVTIPPLTRTQLDPHPWRTFFSLTGGSLLYCLSALSIVFGIAKILGPLLSQTDIFYDALPCLGALNVYELALLGVLLFIVVKEKVTDDAISLVVISALFLIGSGLTLSTVANSSPGAGLAIGVICLLLAACKLYALKKHIGIPINRGTFWGLIVALAWNFTAGAMLTKITVDGAGREDWLLSWFFLLIGCAIVYVSARMPDGQTRESPDTPFLRSPAMPLLFALLIMTAAAVHQYVLGYIFEFEWQDGDYLPLVCLGSLLALKLSLSLRERPGFLEAGLAAAPLALCALCVLDNAILCTPSFSLEALWYPPILLAIVGVAVSQIYFRTGSRLLLAVMGAYLLGIILTWGYSPGELSSLNWRLVGGITVATVLTIGLAKRNAAICFIAIVLATCGIATTQAFGSLRDVMQLTYPGAIVGIAGLATLALALLFGRKTPPALIVGGSFGVMCMAFDAFTTDPSLADAAIISAVLVLAIAVYRRTDSWIGPVILLLPAAQRLWTLFNLLAGWRYIILSFVLLFVGAWVSVRKGRSSQKTNEDSPDHTNSI